MHSYGPLISDVWKDIHRISHKKRRDEHPCQLPIPLIVAKRLGRNYIAIDIDSKYMKITKEKLENVQPTKINNTYVSIYLGKIITIRDKDWENLKFLNKVSSEKSKINNKIPTLFWIILTNFISSSFSTMLGILYIFETLKKVPKVEK